MAIFEIGSFIAFLAVLGWALQSRNPLNLGAVIGGFMLFGFDWLWCTRGFFNVTVNQSLFMMPGIHILGETYPLTFACSWSIGFGLLPLLFSRFHDHFSQKLGVLHVPVILVACGVIDLLLEIALVTGLGAYTYHQQPQYLLWGVPWSNFWFGGGLLALPYFGFAYVKKWAGIPDNAGFSLNSENTWKGLIMAAATLWASFFFLTVLQLFWYSATAPWSESGRMF